MLSSVLSPAACASCRLCCHFERESLWELPALEAECAARMRERGLCLVERAEGGETFAVSCPSGGSQGSAPCPLLDVSSGCLLPREERPLECRLWPLRLMVDEGELVVACYRHCPGLEGVSRGELVALAESLRPLFLARAESFPESARALHERYVVLVRLGEWVWGQCPQPGCGAGAPR